jgi:hypothetical protein
VEVLDDQNRRPPGQLTPQRAGDFVRSRLARHRLLELAARGLGKIEEGPEGARRQQRFARSPEDSCACTSSIAELLEERRLTDPGFAADQNEAPAPAVGGGVEVAIEIREEIRAFQELNLLAARPHSPRDTGRHRTSISRLVRWSNRQPIVYSRWYICDHGGVGAPRVLHMVRPSPSMGHEGDFAFKFPERGLVGLGAYLVRRSLRARRRAPD